MDQIKELLTNEELEIVEGFEEAYKELEIILQNTEHYEEDMLLFLLGVPDKNWK